MPSIAASLIAFLWLIPTPTAFERVPYLNWATIVVALSMVFYLRLSVSLALGMLLFSLCAIAGIIAYERYGPTPLWQLALAVFVVAWIGQFIGHAVEGKKPSFFQDLQFLLIGPIWLLGFVYRKLRIPY